MRRRIIIAVLVLAVAAVPVTILAWPRKVQVKTGERVVCTYGEVLSSNVSTVEVRAKDAAGYGVHTETITCSRHREAERLYGEAQAALASKDVKKAEKALKKLVAIDPGFAAGNGAKQLDELEKGDKPKPDEKPPEKSAEGGGGSNTTPPPAVLLDYVPDSLPGYTADRLMSDGVSVSRTYLPTGSSDVELLTIVAEQLADAAAAKKALAALKTDYPADAKTISVEGRSCYFGSRGGEFALETVRGGSILVAVEGRSKSGKPAGLRDKLTTVLKAILR